MRNVSRVFNLAEQDIVDYEGYAKQLASLLRDNQRLLEDVLEGLFHVALADGVFHPSEELKSMRHHLSTKQPQAKWVSLHAVTALRKQGCQCAASATAASCMTRKAGLRSESAGLLSTKGLISSFRYNDASKVRSLLNAPRLGQQLALTQSTLK